MVSTNRILTVSYGTFSCTLEGFDDPFSTMKSIAEYFRDLAADDRYFGAEPPTPDAEMLHRIAEREIQKRVEARVSEHGVVLRQAEAGTAPAALVTGETRAEPVREEAQAQPEPTPAEAEESRAEAAEAAPAPVRPETAEEEPAEAPSESVAAKLLRIRAAAQTAAAEYAEDEHADELFAEAPIEAAFADVLEEAMTGEDERKEEDAALAEAREDEARAYAPDYEDSFASRQEAESDAAEAYAEEIDEELAAYMPAGEGDAPQDVAEDLAEDQTDEDTAIAAVLGAVSQPRVMEEPDGETETQPAAEMMPEAAAPEEEEAEAEETAPRRPIARVIKVRRSAAWAEAEIEAEAEAEVEAETDYEEEAAEPASEFAVPGESSLSEEDEAELTAELAEVEREAREAHDALARAMAAKPETEAEEGAEAETPAAPAAPRRVPSRTAFDDADMSRTEVSIDRILEKTNTHLESGEATRRRSAIQHLKAAVQATRADREAGHVDDGEAEEETLREAYREDLARAVRPRRPEGTDRPQRRLAPLVLVSEQRIDAAPEPRPEPGTPSQPVRPRRVTKGNLAVADEEALETGAIEEIDENEAPMVAGFRAYLSDQGVAGDADIVEAGVAYVTQEVGRASVTRPQLMTLVLSAAPGMSRETGLRAFGSLLRDGKIGRMKRGLFVLGENSQFYADDLD